MSKFPDIDASFRTSIWAGVVLALVTTVPAGGVVGAEAQDASTSVKQQEAEKSRTVRKKAAHRRRRIIMNNDGNDGRDLQPGEKKTPGVFLSKRISPLAGSQVDAIFYCTGVFNLYSHNSEETELRKHSDRYQMDWAWELTKVGTDSLKVVVDFCHKHDMEAFWSMRMNDTHDSGDPALFCHWKKDHPQYLMGKGSNPHGGGRWSAVNYAVPEVRDKVFRIFQDVCTRYDVDGIEMDFFRHPVFFKPQMTGDPVTQEQCDMMTDLLRRVRGMAEEIGAKRGRPVLIAVRVPDSLGFAKAIGLDVARWLEDDLVDIVTGGGYFHFEPWENLVWLGKKHDVAVYACLSGSRAGGQIDPGKPLRSYSHRSWNIEARHAWQAGVDGIYTFNCFDPKSPLFRELGSPDSLRKPDGQDWFFRTGPKWYMEKWLKGGSKFLKVLDQHVRKPKN